MTTVQIFRRQSEKLGSNPAAPLLACLVWAGWLWLYAPTLRYLQHIFTLEDFRTNQIILIAIIGLVGYRWVESIQNITVSETEHSEWLPLALMISATAGWLAAERWLAINTISATLFGIGTYGLLGLSIGRERWIRGLPAALLIIGTLPFGAHIETFLGYPLRIGTAQLVRDGLAAAGVASIGVDTILIFENGVSNVDLPCSGVQSLWTGSLFFLAATWLEEKKISFKWVFGLIAFAIMLIVANTARVAILVTVGEVMGWRLAAEMLHVPLGVLGFVAACAAALFILRHLIPSQSPTRANKNLSSKTSAPIPFFKRYGVPIILIIVSSFLYAARPISGLTAEAQPLIFPAALNLIHEPLKADEYQWLTKDGADSAERYSFSWESDHGTRKGSMILISSRSWRAHHRPERCFEVYGLDVNDGGTHLVTPAMPIREVNLASKDGKNNYQAVYWFQSADTITDDYGSRLWADVSQPNTRWMLVSILFDETYPPNDPAVQEFYLALNQTIEANLNSAQK